MSARAAGPFSARSGALIAFIGIVGFFALMWAMGNAMDPPDDADSGATSRTRGFDGYAAMAQYLKKRGFEVDTLENEAMANQPGLLILTPPHDADLKAMERLLTRHRRQGPAIVIIPKWKPVGGVQFVPAGKFKGGAVQSVAPKVVHWPGWHDDITLDLYGLDGPQPGAWSGFGTHGRLPETQRVVSGEGDDLVPLVIDSYSERTLAAYLADGGNYPALRAAASDPGAAPTGIAGSKLQPLIMVFEPDLLNNYGYARREGADLTERLVRAALGPGEKRIVLDQTLTATRGQPQQGPSLLKQAFKPPFLAATICLVLAIGVAFWRALHRFGPPLLAARSIAFGKRALVANAAGLIQRARRLHLLGPPYADAARDRLSRALALPARLDPAETELAIDRALAARAPHSEPFSSVAARLRRAQRPTDLIGAARQLHSLERTLLR